MLDFVCQNEDFTCFYNGPKCGASAPDHLHFQACPKGLMPLAERADRALSTLGKELKYLTSVKEARLFHLEEYSEGIYILQASTAKSMTKLFYRLLDCAPVKDGDSEPRINVIVWREGDEYRSAVIFREKHRSRHFASQGPDNLRMSPGCADMGGVFITTREEDFEKLDSDLLGDMISEVTLSKEEDEEIQWKLTRKKQ